MGSIYILKLHKCTSVPQQFLDLLIIEKPNQAKMHLSTVFSMNTSELSLFKHCQKVTEMLERPHICLHKRKLKFHFLDILEIKQNEKTDSPLTSEHFFLPLCAFLLLLYQVCHICQFRVQP